MKKYITNISLLAILVSFASCTQDNELAMFEAGGNTVLKDKKISRLDTNSDINITVIAKDGVTVSSLEIYRNSSDPKKPIGITLGEKVADATVSGDIATFSSSKLTNDPNFASNKSTSSGTIALIFVTTYSNGSKTTNPYTLTVARGIEWKVLDEDGVPVTKTTSGVTDIKYLDNTTGTNVLRYGTYKKYANTVIDAVTVQWKKNKLGTYSVGDASFPKDKGEIDLGELDYAAYGLGINDTIYYKISVKAGTQTDYITTAIAIGTQDFGASSSATLSNDLTANKFSFETGLNYEDTNSAAAEAAFASPFGLSKSGATLLSFVKSSTTDYENSDLFTAEEDFMSGTAVTSLTGLTKDDVIIYKIVREDITYYGLIKIGDLTSINSGTTQTFNFKYKEGTILGD